MRPGIKTFGMVITFVTLFTLPASCQSTPYLAPYTPSTETVTVTSPPVTLTQAQTVTQTTTVTATSSANAQTTVTATRTVTSSPITVTGTTSTPPPTTSSGVISVTAAQLCSASSNQIAFDLTYKGKVLQVTGKIISINSGSPPWLGLDGGFLSSVICNFSSTSLAVLATLQSGQMVTVQGTCTGLYGLFGDTPTLTGCLLVQ